MHHAKLSDLRASVPPARRRADLALVPAPGAASLAQRAAVARVRQALARTWQEFLDRAGFVELDRPADAALAAHLGRTCWTTRDGQIHGQVAGADGAALIDLLERGLASAIHGALSRAYSDLQTLGVDLDRLKYLHLPITRRRQAADPAHRAADLRTWVPTPAGLARDRAGAVLAEAGEPVLVVTYTDAPVEDADGAAPVLLAARLLLPGAGCVATATQGGIFDVDLAALTQFLCAARVAVLARPALALKAPDEL